MCFGVCSRRIATGPDFLEFGARTDAKWTDFQLRLSEGAKQPGSGKAKGSCLGLTALQQTRFRLDDDDGNLAEV